MAQARRNKSTQSQTFAARMNHRRTKSERFADAFTRAFGTTAFFLANAVIFAGWFVWNANMIPGVVAFDPYPYGMLTMVVSLEAIFLSVIVLMSQNRAAKVADLREEMNLQINIESEKEITQLLRMVERVEKKLSVHDKEHQELSRMVQTLDLDELQKRVTRELAE